MKKLVGFLMLAVWVIVASGQSHKGFRWINNQHTLYKVDMKTGELTEEKPGGKDISLGTLQYWDSLKLDLPGDLDVVPHFLGDSIVLTIPGTGIVYSLDIAQLRLTRLDRTFFRGYNFNANQFFRKDTLFSIGGEGFWQKHSIITFYDPSHKEWSFYKIANQNPFSSSSLFSGYIPKSDQFFSANISSSFFADSTDIYVSIFHFNTHRWEIKGEVEDNLSRILKSSFKSVWTGEYLFLYNILEHDWVYILDPINNIQYKYTCPKDHFFLGITDVYAKKGYLYSRDITSSGVSDKKGLDSISISSILRAAQKNGKVYTKSIPVWYYIIPAILLVGVICYVFLKNKKSKTKARVLSLSELELASIQEFLASPTKKFTTLEVNTLLNIEKKTYDNQRQIRNRIIATINQQFLDVLEHKELIYRSPNAEDKRMMEYYINPELKPKELEKVKESLIMGH